MIFTTIVTVSHKQFEHFTNNFNLQFNKFLQYQY